VAAAVAEYGSPCEEATRRIAVVPQFLLVVGVQE